MNVEEEEKRNFFEIGINLKPGFCTFKIDEDDERWPSIKELVNKYSFVDFTYTEFSRTEIEKAKYLAISASWHHGYPQPEDNFGFLEATYDLSQYCKTCGSGLIQKAPFRFKKAPAWGKKSILQANWIFDEYFVPPDVWERVFKPLGIECRPVLLHKDGLTIETVVQLDVSHIVELQMNDIHNYYKCDACGIKKYPPISRGHTPSPRFDTNHHMFKSAQYFGSGGVARKIVLGSHELQQAISSAGIKGGKFLVCGDPN